MISIKPVSCSLFLAVLFTSFPALANSKDEVSAIENQSRSPDAATLSVLKELNDICNHLKGAAKNLIGETQQADLVTVGSGSLLQTAVTQAGPGSMMLAAYLPPRKKWVDFHMSHISYLYPELKSEINAIQIPGTVNGAAEMLADMKNELTNLTSFYNTLVLETKGPPYDGIAISRDAGGVQIEIERIDKDRKDLEKLVHKAEK